MIAGRGGLRREGLRGRKGENGGREDGERGRRGALGVGRERGGREVRKGKEEEKETNQIIQKNKSIILDELGYS